jgi:hypothetical protein
MQFSLRSLMFALLWFGLAALALAEVFRFGEAADVARADGAFVCGESEMLFTSAFGLAVLAGVLALLGRHRTAAIIGGVTAFLIVLVLMDTSI